MCKKKLIIVLISAFTIQLSCFASGPFDMIRESLVPSEEMIRLIDKDNKSANRGKENGNDDKVRKVRTEVGVSPSLEARVDDWYILKANVKNKKICYMVKYPNDKMGNHKASRKPYLIISYINSKRYEILLSSGYKYRPGSSPSISIDGAQFNMFEKKNICWPSGNNDQDIIELMFSSFRLIIKSDSSIGTYSVDIYNLNAFKDAYKKMMSIC